MAAEGKPFMTSPSLPFSLSPFLAVLAVDPYILAFSAVTVLVTIWMGFWSAKRSKTASDFFVAGRSVSVGWNASAISGEYLSAASFMGIAGMVMSSGYDALWYPVCYACGYLFLLLFIAGPLRRFGAYTIPDFAEGRFDSPLFRKIAVVFVLFIGFFYTMPQMKGAGTTLAYIFPGLPYWAGVVLVGAVITLNVALGGMKGITLVQAFQYWAKMFAISVPIFVLMAVYGHYGKQVGLNGEDPTATVEIGTEFKKVRERAIGEKAIDEWRLKAAAALPADALVNVDNRKVVALGLSSTLGFGQSFTQTSVLNLCQLYGKMKGKDVFLAGIRADYSDVMQPVPLPHTKAVLGTDALRVAETALINAGFILFRESRDEVYFARANLLTGETTAPIAENFLVKFEGQINEERLQQFGCVVRVQNPPAPVTEAGSFRGSIMPAARLISAWMGGHPVFVHTNLARRYSAPEIEVSYATSNDAKPQLIAGIARFYQAAVLDRGESVLILPVTLPTNSVLIEFKKQVERASLPPKAPADGTWLNPFGPLTTKAAKNAAAAIGKQASGGSAQGIGLRTGLAAGQRMTVNLDSPTVAQALGVYAELTGRQLVPNTNSVAERVDELLGGKLSQLKLVARTPLADAGVREHADGPFTATEVKSAIEAHLRTNGLAVVPVGEKGLRVDRATANRQQDAGGTLASAEKAWLAKHEKPLALLYTYSLIIAIVCGTAGLPHILVRFYTNPDGTAAKKTTMWVMILIGVFYLFPPVCGVIGRNLLPELYAATGAKGTDKIVLELPRLLNAKYAPLGSILSGITCAGAFAAFMSTFSGLLVSMTGALAHDVYGRILRPKATADERMRMFKIGAVIIGAVAIVLGMQVEQLQINFMVGQAFAIAAASYFPLLFMAVWWRKLTMKGAATGMLAGGLLALTGISLTSFSDLKWIDLAEFWAAHPLLRILCEQPAIWAVPLAILLMVVVSKLTAREVPSDIRMKMLVLHAPEQLGLKQEYIQEHQPH
jgi:Na+(H+)/acetate symporter ActP